MFFGILQWILSFFLLLFISVANSTVSTVLGLFIFFSKSLIYWRILDQCHILNVQKVTNLSEILYVQGMLSTSNEQYARSSAARSHRGAARFLIFLFNGSISHTSALEHRWNGRSIIPVTQRRSQVRFSPPGVLLRPHPPMKKKKTPTEWNRCPTFLPSRASVQARLRLFFIIL